MYPHHRDGSPTRWDKFAHLWLSNVAIVPTVRVSAIALVLLKSLKRTAVPHFASQCCGASRVRLSTERAKASLDAV
ncbi:MAG TPA: hypothetical protein DEF45_05605 [Rhodopirellula sp.]|nr:hypothetical protein [Rhodopirellula sp.]